MNKKTNRKERLEVKAGRSMGAWLLTVMLWLFFLGTIGYLILFSPYLALETPRITGLSTIDNSTFQEEVRSELGQQFFGRISRNRFFLARPEKLAETLKARYPLIRTISIERTFPSSLAITVGERETIVLWCSMEKCFHILEDGSVLSVTDVYREEPSASHTLTITDESNKSIEPGENVFEPEFSSFPVELRRVLQEKLGIAIERQMTVSSRFANELRVTTSSGWQLFVSTRLPVVSSVDTLKLLFDTELPIEAQSKLRYIDLRTENRIFYRYQDGHEEQINASSETGPTEEAAKKDASKAEKKKKKE